MANMRDDRADAWGHAISAKDDAAWCVTSTFDTIVSRERVVNAGPLKYLCKPCENNYIIWSWDRASHVIVSRNFWKDCQVVYDHKKMIGILKKIMVLHRKLPIKHSSQK